MNPIISLKDLHMQYGKGPYVLNGINLDVFPGQIIGYIGPNGAGKSTTIKLMLGLIDDFKGEVIFFGKSVKESTQYKKRIGYVPESADLYENLTAKEYLTFIGEMYGLTLNDVENKAVELMRLLGIEDQFNSRISSFSKGMRQKVLIIASLIHNPDVLFLDEPLNGLDANSVMIIKEILKAMASKGKTVFYSSHIMEVVESISDRIILINNGIITANGTIDEIKEINSDGSLETVFNQLTGFSGHCQIAEEFIEIIGGC